jgi:hypothetical protein
MGSFDDREGRTSGANDGLLPGEEPANHLHGVGAVVLVGDRGERGELAVAARRPYPRALIRSAMRSTAMASSVYSVSNMRCRVWNIGPVTFQW